MLLSTYECLPDIKSDTAFYKLVGFFSLDLSSRSAHISAANFGVPQDRERFFFIAARSGYPLPATLAQPTHYCPSRRSLDVPLPHEQAMRSATVPRGTATFPPVTIEDAIDDLPRFNWYVLLDTST
jgi:DNA (cytosine-5)-methyltransferase 1